MDKLLIRICLVIILTLSIVVIRAQTTGKVIESTTVKSSILGKNVRYSIYLPPDYANSERAYPVVYLLHGFTDDNTTWLQSGEVNRFSDKAIAEGTLPSMIIAMPNADSTWYINSYDGKEKYEDFFIKEFMPAMEKCIASKPKNGTVVLPAFQWAVTVVLFTH